MQDKIKVAVNGYGVIGKRVADAVRAQEDMTALDQAQGTEAARLYLEQMTAHHKGAVDMAKDEAKDGQNPQAVQLAEQVIADQEAEITEMQQMLDKL